MEVIAKLSKLGCPAEVLQIQMQGTKARVVITPGLKKANFTPAERQRFLRKIARLVTIHIDWPRQDGHPKRAVRVPAESSASLLIFVPAE